MKHFLESWTIRFNGLLVVLGSLAWFLSDYLDFVPQVITDPKLAALVVALINVGLRFKTTAPISMSKPEVPPAS